MGALHGWSQEADGGVVRIWELMTGVSVAASAKPPSSDFKPKEYPRLPVKETIDALPPVYTGNVIDTIRNEINNDKTPLIIALDDDPTGTQTCHDIDVLTIWDYATLCAELRTANGGFFILTNSRALLDSKARELSRYNPCTLRPIVY